MEKRKFFSDLFFVQGINVLVKVIWILVIDRAVQNLLPNEDYGMYYRLLSLSILFVIFLDLGLNNMNSRQVAQDKRYFNTNFFSFFKTKAALALLYSSLLIIAFFALELTPVQGQILLILGLFQVVNSFNQYLRSNLAAMHYFKLDGLLAVADRLLVIFICGSWLLIPQYKVYLTVRNFAMVQLGGVLLTISIALIANYRKVDLKDKLPTSESITKLIKASLPYALLIALMAIFTRIDAIMIGQILGDDQTDRYAMCYRLLDAANMMAALFSGMLLPMFSKIIKSKEQIRELTSVAVKVLIIPALFGALVLAPHAREILELMYSQKVSLVAPTTFILLLFSFISSASVFVFGTLLTADGSLKRLNQLALFSALTNLILNLFLIPHYGIKGAATATLITQSLFAIGCITVSYKRFELFISNRIALKIIGLLAVFVIVFYGSKQFLENSFVHISFGILLSVLLVVGGGIINPSVLKNLSRRKTHNPSDN